MNIRVGKYIMLKKILREWEYKYYLKISNKQMDYLDI